MQRLDASPDTWRAWRTHLAGQGTTVALATASATRPGTLPSGSTGSSSHWAGPALLPLGLLSGRFAPRATVRGGASPVRTGTLSLDDEGLRWAPGDGGEATTLDWDQVASAEVVRAWWRSRAGVRLRCRDHGDLWFDAPDAEGLEKALDAVTRA